MQGISIETLYYFNYEVSIPLASSILTRLNTVVGELIRYLGAPQSGQFGVPTGT